MCIDKKKIKNKISLKKKQQQQQQQQHRLSHHQESLIGLNLNDAFQAIENQVNKIY